jgi:hypothetical protein
VIRGTFIWSLMPENDSQFEWLLQSQKLRQQSEMGCGVCVFSALLNLSEEQILADVPHAKNGMTLDQWCEYAKTKGWELIVHQQGQKHTLPCAHLHEIAPGYYHWIYQAEDSGIHDPNPSWQHYPPKLVKLSFYKIKLTVTLKKLSEM